MIFSPSIVTAHQLIPVAGTPGHYMDNDGLVYRVVASLSDAALGSCACAFSPTGASVVLGGVHLRQALADGFAINDLATRGSFNASNIGTEEWLTYGTFISIDRARSTPWWFRDTGDVYYPGDVALVPFTDTTYSADGEIRFAVESNVGASEIVRGINLTAPGLEFAVLISSANEGKLLRSHEGRRDGFLSQTVRRVTVRELAHASCAAVEAALKADHPAPDNLKTRVEEAKAVFAAARYGSTVPMGPTLTWVNSVVKPVAPKHHVLSRGSRFTPSTSTVAVQSGSGLYNSGPVPTAYDLRGLHKDALIEQELVSTCYVLGMGYDFSNHITCRALDVQHLAQAWKGGVNASVYSEPVDAVNAVRPSFWPEGSSLKAGRLIQVDQPPLETPPLVPVSPTAADTVAQAKRTDAGQLHAKILDYRLGVANSIPLSVADAALVLATISEVIDYRIAP